MEIEPAVHVIRMPEHHGAFSPIPHVVPLQRFNCWRIALPVRPGWMWNKPRNRGKSLPVE